jgi:Protein of unknown function (DUF3892)
MKWADFCVTRVKYGRDRTAIVEIEAKPDHGDSLGASQRFSRQSVVEAIRFWRTTFATAPVKDGKYVRGADVNVVEVRDEYFLRTDQNAIRSDNLGQLPEYC